jgi:hypothetical protein
MQFHFQKIIPCYVEDVLPPKADGWDFKLSTSPNASEQFVRTDNA